MSSNKKDDLIQVLKENEDEIKSGLKIAGQAIETAYEVHKTVKEDEQKVAGEMSQSESRAEQDTFRAAKEIHKEEEDVEAAESSLKNGLDSLGKLVKMIKREENELDADIDELKQISQTLANNPRNINQSHIKSIVDVAGEAYSMVEAEINVERRIADYFIQYATDLEKVVEEEGMIHQDISKLEEETRAEAQRTSHKERIGKLMKYESGEEKEFNQEIEKLKTEFGEEDEELQMLQKEVIHTKEEIDSLIDTLTTIESYLKDLGHQKAFGKLENIRESVEKDYDNLRKVENEIEKAENMMSEAESEAANI